MVIYTPMPPEVVLSQEGTDTLEERDVRGVRLLVRPLPDGRCRIERVLSTDPLVFLNTDFTPGNVIIDPGASA
ncbi:MAG: YlzJ-like family protein [Bacillota bacterium]